MKVGCYQCKIKTSDFDANLETLLQGMEQGAEERVEILAFPEAFLNGYYASESIARKEAFRLDGLEIQKVLEKTADFSTTFMAGFTEILDENIHDTVLVAERGHLLGVYRKAFPVLHYATPSRQFPVFKRGDVKFGVIICADGAYIEPARILALKGARIIFAPHYNHLYPEWVVVHHNMVRHDHIARAVENGVYFMRANNITDNYDEGLEYTGVGYGDSYLLDPLGMVVAHAGLHSTFLLTANLDLERQFYRGHAFESRISGEVLFEQLKEALGKES